MELVDPAVEEVEVVVPFIFLLHMAPPVFLLDMFLVIIIMVIALQMYIVILFKLVEDFLFRVVETQAVQVDLAEQLYLFLQELMYF